MNRISTSLSVAALALAGLALSAEDFQPLMKATQATWPEKRHIGVICNYQANQSQVWALAKAAGEGAHITVVDTRTADQSSAAAYLLANQKADYLVLMPGDRNFRDGSFAEAEAISGQTMANTILVNRGTCFSCGVACKREVEVPERGVSAKYGGMEYEIIGALGSTCGVGDLKAVAEASQWVNNYVLDGISTGVAIAFAMECYENGLIVK